MTQIGSSRGRPRGRSTNSRSRSASRTGRLYRSTTQQEMGTSAWTPTLNLEWGKFPDVVLIGILVILLIFFFQNLRFFVGGVEISGNKVIGAQEIMKATGLHDDSIFYVNTEQIAQTIRREFPSVASVKVHCGLPARVRIELQECAAQAVWETTGGRFLVGSDGRALKVAPVTLAKDAILIRDRTAQPLKICEQGPTPTPEKVEGGKAKVVENCSVNKAAVQTACLITPRIEASPSPVRAAGRFTLAWVAI
jgi:hypothetical protein